MNIQDLTSLYQLAQQADIKAGQSRDVSALFERVEQSINAESLRPHVEAALAAQAAQERPPVAPTPVAG